MPGEKLINKYLAIDVIQGFSWMGWDTTYKLLSHTERCHFE